LIFARLDGAAATGYGFVHVCAAFLLLCYEC
jgi:hypothetical protein